MLAVLARVLGFGLDRLEVGGGLQAIYLAQQVLGAIALQAPPVRQPFQRFHTVASPLISDPAAF